MMDGKRAPHANAFPSNDMSGSAGGCGRAQHPPVPGLCEPRRHLPSHTLPVEMSPAPCAHTHGCAYKWHLEIGHSYYHEEFRRPAHTPLAPTAFFFFSFIFFVSFPSFFSLFLSNFGDKKPPRCFSSGLQLTELSTAQHAWCFAVPKGSHCVKGFLLNRTKQNSKAVGLLGCWRETIGKQNSGRSDIYFSEGHGCPYTIPFEVLWSFSNTIQFCSQAEIQHVWNLFIAFLI